MAYKSSLVCLLEGLAPASNGRRNIYRYRKPVPTEGGDDIQMLVVPRCSVPTVLTSLHNKGGHFRVDKTVGHIVEVCWWPGYTKDVKDYVQSCDECSRKKRLQQPTRAQLQTIPVGGPMEMLAMDFIGPLPVTDSGNKYILVVADYYTKWAEAFPLRDQRAETVARVLVRDIISHFRVPRVLHSDQGANFEGSVMKEMCKLLGMKKTRTTAYDPQM